MTRRKYTDEDLLFFITDLSKEIGKTPTISDMNNKAGFPSHRVFGNRFGSWNNALELAGLRLNTNFKLTKEKIKSEIISFNLEHGRTPLYNEMSFSTTAWRNHWNSWNDLLKDCDLEFNKNYHDMKSKEDGIDYLKKLSIKLNRTPRAKDATLDGVNSNWFTKKYGSWKNALFMADLIDEKELNNNYDDMAYQSINYLSELSEIIKRVPTVEEYEVYLKSKEKGTYLSRRNLCNRLNKTYSEICEKYLPLSILEKHSTFYFNKNGKLCRSVAELNISNLLIDNGFNIDYEPSYSEISNKKFKYKFDWRINNVYIEYFGMYHENTSGNKILEEYKKKTYIKIGICKTYNVNLVTLFPSDLDDNFKGVKDKLSNYDINIHELLQNKIS